MTAWDVAAALIRRWYLVLTGFALTAGSVWYVAPGQHLYSARTSVVFLWPGSVPVSQTDDGGLAALVNFAAMVRLGLEMDQERASDSVSFGGSLAGAGVSDGYTVILPNAGGQWSRMYNQPRLVIEAVDADPAVAGRQAEALVAEVRRVADDLQNRIAMQPESVIASAPAPVEVLDVGASPGTRLRALIALGALGAASTVAMTVAVDTAVTSRRRATSVSRSGR